MTDTKQIEQDDIDNKCPTDYEDFEDCEKSADNSDNSANDTNDTKNTIYIEKEGKKLVHNYVNKENWDGHFCPDFCSGCGCCSCRFPGHEPTKYAIPGYNVHIRYVDYYCKSCFEKNKTSDQTLSDFFANKKEHDATIKYDITLYRDYYDGNKYKYKYTDALVDIRTKCSECLFELEPDKNDDDFMIEYEYGEQIFCDQCVVARNLDKPDKLIHERTGSKFICICCDRNFKIVPGEQFIKCDDISKIDVFQQKQLFIDLNGNATTKEFVQKV
jgi:hypothetical protein